MSESLVEVGDEVVDKSLVWSGALEHPRVHICTMKSINGVKVNPAHYYFNDLTPAEYEALLEASEKETQSLD